MESLTNTFTSGTAEVSQNLTLKAGGIMHASVTFEEALARMSPQDPRRGGSNPNITVYDEEPTERVAPVDLSSEVQIDPIR